MIRRFTFLAGVAAVLCISAAPAVAQSKCDAAKLKEYGKRVACLAKVDSTANKRGEAADATKADACMQKFAQRCATAESYGDCTEAVRDCDALATDADTCRSASTQPSCVGDGQSCVFGYDNLECSGTYSSTYIDGNGQTQQAVGSWSSAASLVASDVCGGRQLSGTSASSECGCASGFCSDCTGTSDYFIECSGEVTWSIEPTNHPGGSSCGGSLTLVGPGPVWNVDAPGTCGQESFTGSCTGY